MSNRRAGDIVRGLQSGLPFLCLGGNNFVCLRSGGVGDRIFIAGERGSIFARHPLWTEPLTDEELALAMKELLTNG